MFRFGISPEDSVNLIEQIWRVDIYTEINFVDKAKILHYLKADVE